LCIGWKGTHSTSQTDPWEMQGQVFDITFSDGVQSRDEDVSLHNLELWGTEGGEVLCWIMIGVLVIYGLWTVVESALMCIPVAYFWDQTTEGGQRTLLGTLGFLVLQCHT